MLILGSFSWWNSFSLPFAKADRHLIAIIPGDIAGNEFTVHTYGLAWDSIFLGLHSCSSLQLIPFFNMNVCYVIRCTYQSYRMYIHLPFNRWLGSLSCTYPSFRMYIHRDVRTILNNRHLLNVRAILFLLQNIWNVTADSIFSFLFTMLHRLNFGGTPP